MVNDTDGKYETKRGPPNLRGRMENELTGGGAEEKQREDESRQRGGGGFQHPGRRWEKGGPHKNGKAKSQPTASWGAKTLRAKRDVRRGKTCGKKKLGYKGGKKLKTRTEGTARGRLTIGGQQMNKKKDHSLVQEKCLTQIAEKRGKKKRAKRLFGRLDMNPLVGQMGVRNTEPRSGGKNDKKNREEGLRT